MQQLLFAQEYEDCNYLWLYVSQSLWLEFTAATLQYSDLMWRLKMKSIGSVGWQSDSTPTLVFYTM